ncbi:MAG TPA: efflux RND transporter periplasmic adaptor subunit [Caulobacteraceae bacterium]
MPSLKSSSLVAAGLALALGLASCGPKAKPVVNPQANARSVTLAVVENRAIEGGLIASGVLVPREDTAILPDVTGYRVARVLSDEGEWVRAGQPLAAMDDSLLRAQVDQQVALAAQQRVAAERAEAEAARVKGIDTEGLLSQEQIDARRFAARNARAAAVAQDAAAAAIREREAHMIVRAPYAGLVIERNVRQGDLSGVGTTAWFRIAKDGQVELAADVSESALGKLHPGVPAKVTLADGTEVIGQVRLVSPRVDTATKLGRVRIALPVRSEVRSGGFAKASFSGVSRPSLSVPETAVRYDADGAAVMVVDANNRTARVPVTTGQHGGGFVELLVGPPAGSKVVAKASAQLTPGDYVKPTR